ISAKTVKALQAHAISHQTSLASVLSHAANVASLSSRAVKAITTFDGFLRTWRSLVNYRIESPSSPTKEVPDSLRDFVERVLIESGLESYYRRDGNDPEHERLANLGELISAAQIFESENERDALASQTWAKPGGDLTENNGDSLGANLLAFLERISLISDLDTIESSQGAVTLMTLHAAKGLEFPVVAIVAVEDGLLPHSQSQEDKQLEEERRLCFVGITRAQQHLILTHTRFRTIFGMTQATIPSRFLAELPEEELEKIDETARTHAMLGVAHGEEGHNQWKDTATRAGALVKHRQFGLGRVLTVTASGANTRARIDFDSVGIKTLILQYAPLELLE
ncbi:MAG: 3'-5' exonuclease, partial [Pirellulaceae bacterium]|nr:3'-5' exonuclease [Pirellulaceae bacterium]